MKSTTKSQVKPLDVTRATVAEIKRAIKEKIPLIGIYWFGTHYKPDVDEVAGVTLLLVSKLSRKFFPEIAEGKTLYLRTITKGDVARLGEDAWYKLLQKGGLAIGIAGGPMDDHGEGTETSAAQKVAEFLGVEKKPWLKQLLGYVNHEDNSGQKSIPDGYSGPTGPMIKATWRVLDEDGRMDEMEERVVGFVKMFQLHLTDQMRFSVAKRELARDIHLVPLNGLPERIPGKIPNIAVAESGSERVVAVTRYLHNKNHDLALIVRISPTGNFSIHEAKEGSVSTEQMDQVVRMLRLHFVNFLNKGRSRKIRLSDEDLVMYGEQEDTNEIFYYRGANMVFNGSLTQTEVSPLVGDDDNYPFSRRSLVGIITKALEDISPRSLPTQKEADEEAEAGNTWQTESTTVITGSMCKITITRKYS